jgi:hypothetical protein
MSNVVKFPISNTVVIKLNVPGTHEEYRRLMSGVEQFQAFLDSFEGVYFNDPELNKATDHMFDDVAMKLWCLGAK